MILYTSGTTSDPKGVVLTHGNLLAEREGALSVVSVSERDCVLGVLPLFHALAQMANLLLPFSVGARVVFLESVNTSELLRGLAERGVTIFVCVPQFFYLIHQRVMQEVTRAGAPKRLIFRGLLAANGALRAVGLNAGRALLLARAPGARRIDAHPHHGRIPVRSGDRGRPVPPRVQHPAGVRADRDQRRRDARAAGRLAPRLGGAGAAERRDQGAAARDARTTRRRTARCWYAGPIVMAGYFNRPDATAAAIRDGWFYTGDLGRIDSQGRLTITGRKKEIIVLSNGKNIYPEEIEAHYRQSPFIKELCVLGLTPARRTERRAALRGRRARHRRAAREEGGQRRRPDPVRDGRPLRRSRAAEARARLRGVDGAAAADEHRES